jgi:hypothetical protein
VGDFVYVYPFDKPGIRRAEPEQVVGEREISEVTANPDI